MHILSHFKKEKIKINDAYVKESHKCFRDNKSQPFYTVTRTLFFLSFFLVAKCGLTTT